MAEDGSNPEDGNVQALRPDMPQEPTQHLLVFVPQEQADRIVLGGARRSDVIERETLTDELFECL